LELVRQIAEALKFAHDKHAIHGALSPQSILVFEPDAEVPRLKLYNWQTAFRTSSTSTSGLPQVTPTVLAPFLRVFEEQCGIHLGNVLGACE
jgi:serine/threonine protein kinase